MQQRGRVCLSVAVLAALCFASPQPSRAQQAGSLAPLSAEQVVTRLMEKNQERAAALEHYTARRQYHLEYHGFPSAKEATMEVEMRFDAPGQKHFTVTGETGSKLILNRVFRKLLESEQEAAGQQSRRSALTPENYSFALAGSDGPDYILSVEPRVGDKFLYRGRIWVDGHDFAVTRIEAQPAKNPSFWTTRSEIHHTYQKVGDTFYLPRQNKTVTNVRLGGVATLTIDYLSYDVTSATGQHATAGDTTGAAPLLDASALLAARTLGDR